MSDDALARAVVQSAERVLARSLRKIDHCLAQLNDEQIWWRPTPQQNSIANLLLHLSGNLRQWIVSGVGGAADVRARQQEFDERGPIPKATLRERFALVVSESQAVMAGLTADDLLAARRIQAEDTTVIGALWDTLTHCQGHTQEIICLTRMQLGSYYQYEDVPTRAQGGP